MSNVSPATMGMLRETYKDKGLLLPLIERHVLKERAAETSDRKSTIMHPSEIIKKDWCGRHDFYRITGVPTDTNGKANSFQLERVFDRGHDTHDQYQSWLRDMGVLWGVWECVECGQRWEGMTPTQCAREGCWSGDWVYKEVPLEDPAYMIEGHADGLVVLDETGRLIEIKTIGAGTLRMELPYKYEEWIDQGLTPDEMWYRIKKPFPGHLRQGMVYLHLIRSMGHWPDLDEIVFIYESKMTGATKEFVVKFNPAIVAPILTKASEVVDAVHTNTPPRRPEWAEEDGPKAKGCKTCVYRNTCWGAVEAAQAKEESAVRVRKSKSAVRRSALRSAT